jgi:hypothetical protein
LQICESFYKNNSGERDMKKTLLTIVLSLFALNCFSETRIVYGKDNRIDMKDVRDPRIKNLGKAIAGRIFKYSYSLDAESKYMAIDNLLTLSDPHSMNVCKKERFADQLTIVDCTGFLIAKDLLVTAGHCVVPFGETVENDVTKDCMDNEWLFDFKEDQRSKLNPNKINMKNVYGCEKVVYGVYKEENDFALIKLSNTVTGREPLKLNTKSTPSIGTKIFVMGHPTGLPLKYADGAKVFSNHKNFFSTNLDTFG